jgi:hypothetical protein
MKLLHPNYNGFDHVQVNKRFSGELTYLCDIDLGNPDNAWALYRAKKPNKSKGHKRYMALTAAGSCATVTGFTSIKPEHKIRYGVACDKCKVIIYSACRHDYRKCLCGKVMIDGGNSYSRYFGAALVKLNILTGKVIK